LKTVSNFLDEETASGRPMPRSALDAGCGAGVLGICAAGGLGVRVRAQDRDELARIFTAYNARRNGIDEETLSAYTEPLLSCPQSWDLILSNVPAKAGFPVLEDFVSRSLGLLNPGGRVCIVAVAPLGDFFKGQILKAGAAILREETGPGYRVFAYAPASSEAAPGTALPQTAGRADGEDFLAAHPFYLRNRKVYEMEGISYSLDTIHGAAGFDSPGGAVEAAAKLTLKTLPVPPPAGNILVWEGAQGHFPVWLAKGFFGDSPHSPSFTLGGRNILALEAARHNTIHNVPHAPGNGEGVRIISAADLFLDRERIAALENRTGPHREGGAYSFIAAFPETVPLTGRILPFWEGLGLLAAPGALVIMGLSSAEAERMDRKKPKNFTSLGSMRRSGFRALAYRARG
jgi:SAM-dependent methyltransferase